MIRRYAALAVFGAVAMGLGLGCGPSVNKVEVKVTLDGQPLPGAMVSFTSEGTTRGATGQTDSNGIAKMSMDTAKGKEGVESGSYTVTIVKTERPDMEDLGKSNPGDAMKKMADKNAPPKGAGGPGPGGPPKTGGTPGGLKSLIPVKYNDPKKSGFTCKVPEETGSQKVFALTSDQSDKPEKK